jgi:hypothetical protein
MRYLAGLAILALISCVSTPPEHYPPYDGIIRDPVKPGEPKKPEIPTPVTQPVNKCDVIKEKLLTGNRGTIDLPTSGRAPREAHYVTTNEFADKVWPKSKTDNIQQHLTRSCAMLRVKHRPFMAHLTTGCPEVYAPAKGNREWTPAETSEIGQSAYGARLQPDVELWLLAMNWGPGAKPKVGTRFIVRSLKDPSKVVVAGAGDHGPAAPDRVAGISHEIAYYLGTDQISVGRAAKQDLPLGPIDCSK